MLSSMVTVDKAEIKYVEEVVKYFKITTIVVFLIREIPTMEVTLPISIQIHKIPNLGLQILVLVQPIKFATS